MLTVFPGNYNDYKTTILPAQKPQLHLRRLQRNYFDIFKL